MPAQPAPTRPLLHADTRRSLRDALPVCIGFASFGTILGAQAAQKGMSPLESVLMVAVNYAGGSEFAAVNLWASPLPVLLIWTMTLMINSRHILMSAAMIPHLRGLPLKKLLPTLFVMCDESWALGLADAKNRSTPDKPAPLNLRYYGVLAAALYASWLLSVWVGTLAGPLLGDISRYGFGMAFPAVFLVLLRGMWRGSRAALPGTASLIAAGSVYLLLPASGWYVLAGTAAGLLTAFFAGSGKQPENAPSAKQGAQHD